MSKYKLVQHWLDNKIKVKDLVVLCNLDTGKTYYFKEDGSKDYIPFIVNEDLETITIEYMNLLGERISRKHKEILRPFPEIYERSVEDIENGETYFYVIINHDDTVSIQKKKYYGSSEDKINKILKNMFASREEAQMNVQRVKDMLSKVCV